MSGQVTADDASEDLIQTEDGPRPNSDSVQRAKLRVDARKWLMAKAALIAGWAATALRWPLPAIAHPAAHR